MINDPETLKSWQRILEGKLHVYLADKYPQEMGTYMRFRKSTGPHCAFCKASARLIFKQESVGNPKFLDCFKNNTWDGYI